MGKITGFLDFERHDVKARDYKERLSDWREMYGEIDEEERRHQGGRCMDCGVPFCQSEYGCPVDNLIPEWNDLVYQGKWEEAYWRLRKTNNFPEYTGRICPAPCESSCVLAISAPAVTIKDNEWAIADRGYQEGWIQPRPPATRSDKRIAIVGSGPAGLAAADQLNQAGHTVTVYERDDRIGGLLMYGIPNMKLDKKLVARRNDIMGAEGIIFKAGVEIGRDISLADLRSEYDAVLLAIGATDPHEIETPGRSLTGIHFAMEFLHLATKSLLDSHFKDQKYISARDKNVIVIGSGDTGTDCIATAARLGAKSLVNFGRREASAIDDPSSLWPLVPKHVSFDYGHREVEAKYGRDPRSWGVLTKEFLGHKSVEGVRTVRARWLKEPGSAPVLEEKVGSDEVWPAELVLIAVGYRGPESTLLRELSLQEDERGNIRCPHNTYQSSCPGVFAAGDARRGQSLVVWAIKEGREAAKEIDSYVTGSDSGSRRT